MPLEKYSSFNFHTWKVKIQMQLMNNSPWGSVRGIYTSPTDPNKLLEWEVMMINPKLLLA